MAILQSGVALEVNKVVARPSDPEVAALLDTIRKYAPWLHATSVSFNPDGIGVFLCFFVYSAILVGIGGQTLGMMVTELRVVTTRFGRPSAAQVVWRYVVGLASLTFVLPATLGLFFRIQPHDRLSATRVIRGRIAP